MEIDPDSLRYATSRPPKFSAIELRDIAVSIVVLSMAFALMFRNSDFVKVFFQHYMGSSWQVGMFGLMVLLVVVSFMFHEMAHKFTAQKMGFWSEYRMYPAGLLLALVMGYIGFLFAAPGVVYIRGYLTSEQDGKVSIAGPLMNIILASIGLVGSIALNGEPIVTVFYLLFSLNSALAIFNLLPFGILDGSKVFRWNTPLWLICFVIAGMEFVSRFFLEFHYSF